MDKSMENVREISSIKRTNRNVSDARDRFRYLNSSHRNAGRSNGRSSKRYEKSFEKTDYIEVDDNYIETSSAADKNFKRLMISTGLIAFVLAIKLMDNSFSNSLEVTVTNLIRNSSELDNKISEQMVSLTEKVGINIKGISKTESTSNDGMVDDTITNDITNDNIENQENAQDVSNEVIKGENVIESGSGEISEDQVSDFYIDDSIFEEIKGESKK